MAPIDDSRIQELQGTREGVEGKTVGTLGVLRYGNSQLLSPELMHSHSRQGLKIGIVPVVPNSPGITPDIIFVYAVGEHLFVRMGDEVSRLSADQPYPNDWLQIHGGPGGVSVSPNIGGMCHFQTNELTSIDLSLAKAATPQKPQANILTFVGDLVLNDLADARQKIAAVLKALGIID